MSFHYPKMSYCGKRFANFVMQNKNSVIRMSIGELSDKLGISKASIINITRQLGFEGFSDFKISLASETNNPHEYVGNNHISDDIGFYSQVVRNNIMVLQESENYISSSSLLEATEKILESKRIFFFGVGTSALLIDILYDLLVKYLPNCFWDRDMYYQSLNSTRTESDDVAIVISQSGVNQDIITITENCRKNKTPIIGISNYSITPFSKYVDILLAALANPSEHHQNNFSLMIPIISIIEALFFSISIRIEKNDPSVSEGLRDSVLSFSVYSTERTTNELEK